jgi:small subunit ribosomal protein S1
VQDAGLDVQVGDDGAAGFIKRTDLGRDRDEQRPERFQVGQKLDAMVVGFDRSKKPNFSVKALQIAEEKQAVAQYGSSDSGASLGDILGAALKEAQTAKAAKEPKAEKAEKAPKAEKADKAEKEPKAAKEDKPKKKK